jgi:hypothetical protein
MIRHSIGYKEKTTKILILEVLAGFLLLIVISGLILTAILL